MNAVQQKRNRVFSGSRRKRDLAAAGLMDHADREATERAEAKSAQRERETRLRPQIQSSPAADAAWASVRESLREAVTESTFALWLEPMVCTGEVSGALAVEAPERIFAWASCRYGQLLGRCARDATDYRGVFLFRATPLAPGEDEGLL